MCRTKIMLGIVFAISIINSPMASAEAEDKYWQGLSKSYFPKASISESADIKLTAPIRAESGAQVPFAFSIRSPMTDGNYIKSVTIIADANPVPLVAVFHFTPNSGKAEISTRIRLEVDSFVHVVAETSDGRFLMNKIPIKASGGCGGTIGGDEDIARQSAGKMKLSVQTPGSDNVKIAHLLIKHPMYTGLQRDLVSQGFRPAFFINKIVAKYNDRTVFDTDTYIGLSEDPNIQFPLRADKPGKLTVVIQDNEGKEFSTSTEVN